MIRGIKVGFDADGAKILTEETVQDFNALVQNCLVNIATSQGSDLVYPEKGTELLKDGVLGFLTNTGAVVASSSFASTDTLFFIRQTDYEDTEESIEEILLEPVNFEVNFLELQSQFTSTQGQVIGLLTPINT
jgi:hypothetical protein